MLPSELVGQQRVVVDYCQHEELKSIVIMFGQITLDDACEEDCIISFKEVAWLTVEYMSPLRRLVNLELEEN